MDYNLQHKENIYTRLLPFVFPEKFSFILVREILGFLIPAKFSVCFYCKVLYSVVTKCYTEETEICPIDGLDKHI